MSPVASLFSLSYKNVKLFFPTMTQKGCSVPQVLHAKCQMLFPNFPPGSLIFVTEKKENKLHAACFFLLIFKLVNQVEVKFNTQWHEVGFKQWKQYYAFTHSIKHWSSSGHMQNVTVYMFLFFCSPCICEALYVHFVIWLVVLFLYEISGLSFVFMSIFFFCCAVCQMYCILKGCEGVF